MECRITQAESVGDDQFLVGKHAGLQPVKMPFLCDVLRQVGAYSDHLHTTLIELSAQLFQPTQLADTIGSPVRAKKFDKDEVSIECSRIEALTLAVEGTKWGNSVPNLDDPVGIQSLWTDGDGKWQEQANHYGDRRWNAAEKTRAFGI